MSSAARADLLPDIHRRVVNAKYVLERAAKIQAESNEMSLSISLLLMHDAVELLMVAVLDHLQVTPKKREFMDFWPAIKQAGKPEPPDRVPMDSLNALRVGLKHKGNLPRPQTVRDLFPRVLGFFDNVLKAYCELSYSDVSLIALVPDPEVYSMLRDAQNKFSVGEKAAALTNLKIALHKVEHPKGKHLSLLQAPAKPNLPTGVVTAAWGEYLDEVHSFLRESALRTNALLLGVDPVRYAFFDRNTPNVQWSPSGKSHVIDSSSYRAVSEHDFTEMIDFLIDYALRVSEALDIVISDPFI
jgi:hypothetical protein